MFEAVIFDFDGLILETETPEIRSWEEVFGHYGREYPESYWRFLLGRGAEQVKTQPHELLLQMGVEADAEEVRRMRGRILSRMLAELEVMPGVIDRIQEAESLGMKLGVASSSKHPWVDGHLERLGLLSRFHAIVCAGDVERAKPYPDLYLLACERLEVEPPRAIALEDSPNGTRAARDAGLFVVAVPTYLTAHEDMPADLVVSSLEDLRLSSL
ncbi:MAG TPA: HAD family phosphatase [Fimbriimonadaceae bacterium]|nr:HAD family phosphatase [Fimbriimonadaceae bacterium]